LLDYARLAGLHNFVVEWSVTKFEEEHLEGLVNIVGYNQ
jgi:hypothetical protein